MLLGVDGVVVKTHGKSDASTYEHALLYLVEQVSNYDRQALIDFIDPVRKGIA
jgi:fatty acid/phospholipid biosynthesis enzyme